MGIFILLLYLSKLSFLKKHFIKKSNCAFMKDNYWNYYLIYNLELSGFISLTLCKKYINNFYNL